MLQITKGAVITALSGVEEPNLKRDLVSLGIVKEIGIDGSKISIKIELPTSSFQSKDRIREDCITAIKKEIPEATEIIILFNGDANVRAESGIMPGVKNTIAVASGKGGVGKSTVAANLAIALAKDGAKVGIIDADIYGPSMPLMFGINTNTGLKQDQKTKKLAPLESYGIKLISIGFMIDDDNPVIWRGPMASGALKQFMTDVNWGELDYLIYDLPPGTGDIQLTLVQTIPLTGAVIVTTPQEVSLIDAKKGLKMFERVNVPVFGIIENMSYFIAPDTGKKYDIFGSGGGEKLAVELNSKLLGQIPIDPRIREGGDTGKPIVAEFPDSENGKVIIEIARTLVAQLNKQNDNLDDVEIQL